MFLVRDRPSPKEWGDRPDPSCDFSLGGRLFVIVARPGCVKPFLARRANLFRGPVEDTESICGGAFGAKGKSPALLKLR